MRKALRLASPQSDVNPSVWHSEQEERGEGARRQPGGWVLNLCNWLQQQRKRRAQEDAIKNLISLVKTLFISGESFYSDTGGLAQIYAHRRVSPWEKLLSSLCPGSQVGAWERAHPIKAAYSFVPGWRGQKPSKNACFLSLALSSIKRKSYGRVFSRELYLNF